jgi:antitoxin component of RelBE/YafQ-DinJ toxin-antitoxin module
MYNKKNGLGQVSVTVNKKVWKESKEVLRDLGISRSCFINVTLTQLVRESKGQRAPMERMDDTVGMLFELSKRGRPRKTA